MNGEELTRTSYRVVAWAGEPPPASAEVPLLAMHGIPRDAIPSLEPAARYAQEMAARYPSASVQLVRRHFRRILQIDPDGNDLTATLPTRRTGDDVRWYTWCGKRQHVATTYADAAINAYRLNATHGDEVELWEAVFTDVGHFHGDRAIWFRGELTAAEWPAAFPNQPVPARLNRPSRKRFAVTTRPASVHASPEDTLRILDKIFEGRGEREELGPHRRMYTYEYSAGDQSGISKGLVSATFTVSAAPDAGPGRAVVGLTLSTDLSQFHNAGMVRRALEAARDTQANGIARAINHRMARGGYGMDGPPG